MHLILTLAARFSFLLLHTDKKCMLVNTISPATTFVLGFHSFDSKTNLF